MSRLIFVVAAAWFTLIMAFPFPATAADDLLAEARSLNEQGASLYRQARYAEAEPLLKRSLAIWEKALGAEHPGRGDEPQQSGRAV
jgi:tetratricopeptide repeat protein